MPNYKQELFHKRYRKDVLGFSVFLLILSFALAAFRFNDIRGTVFINPNRYATTQGVIISSQMDERYDRYGKHQNYNIHYEFVVGDTKYTSNQVSFGNTGGDEIVQPYIKKYPVGQRVVVFYLPSDPTFSVLEPDVTDETKPVFVGTCILISIAVIGIFWSYGPLVKRKWRARAQEPASIDSRRPRRSSRLPATHRKAKR